MPIFKTMECDVLVIGGGVAGLGAAIKARDFAERVILVDKAQAGRSGASPFIAGLWLVKFPDDDAEAYMREIIETGEYLSDQEWVKTYLEGIYPASIEIEKWCQHYGMEFFRKDDTGNFIRRQRYAAMASRHCLIHPIPMLDTLTRKAREKGATFVERTIITDLATSGDKVVGAIGLNYRTGDIYLFKAKAVVAAAGMHHFAKLGVSAQSQNGELIAAAYRAGAVLFKLEMACSEPGPRDYASQELMQAALHARGRFVNARGEEFMPEYVTPGKGARMQDFTISFANEIHEGRGPIYADMCQATPEARELMKKSLSHDDFVKARIRWVMVLAGGGGARNNIRCESSLPGLYTAGDTSGAPVIGTYTVPGVNITYSYLSGCIAGENAAQYANSIKDQQWDKTDLKGQVNETIANLNALLDRPKGVRPHEVMHKIQEIMIPWPVAYIRNEQRLNKALAEVKKLREEEIPSLKAVNLHDLLKAHEVTSLVIIAELTLRAALFRKESRGFHYREDYPYTDNRNWLKWVMIKQENGLPKIWAEDVPTPYFSPSEATALPPGVKKTKGDI